MKISLIAINSKYIHSNLAVYCLREAAKEYKEMIQISEYSINNHTDFILRDIYENKPDVLCFSCYIWNITIIRNLLIEICKILPNTQIWLGGPEVSYQASLYLQEFKMIKGIIRGEGEEAFLTMVKCYVENKKKELKQIQGTTVREGDSIIENKDSGFYDLNQSKLPYDLDGEEKIILDHRIIYYESSRGCPFSCSYCLSSVDKKLRFKQIDLVQEELEHFLKLEVPQVKFVDRTFNCEREHAIAIWKYILENDNGITNFHFEISADILIEEELNILSQMRPGLVQLEVGVQTTNPQTIQAINRTMDLEKLQDNILKIIEKENIHIHLDLIAGLPYEGYDSFHNSFNDVYNMAPEQLQLGFLKLLDGTPMKMRQEEYGIVVNSLPPYEVLYTKWITYDEIIQLKIVENVVDMFYNSGMFENALKYLVSIMGDAFLVYQELGLFFDIKYPAGELPSKNGKYDLISDFFKTKFREASVQMIFNELLRYDMFKRENSKSLPKCFLENINSINRIENRKLTRAEHLEIFKVDVMEFELHGNIDLKKTIVHFDYLNRNSLSNNAICEKWTDVIE